MANEQYECYDADDDVMRYLLDPTTDIAMFSEPVVVTVPVTVESHPTPVIHVEQPTQVQISHFNPHKTAGVVLGRPPQRPFPDLDKHRRPAPSNELASPFLLHPHPMPVITRRTQTRPAPTSALDDVLLRCGESMAAARVAATSSPAGLFAASPFPQADDDEVDAILNSFRYEATHGDSGGGGTNAVRIDVLPAEQDADLVPFLPLLPGHLDCSRCHLVRHIMHVTASRTVHFFVHCIAPGTFEHVIVDRTYTAANGRITMEEQLYFDLSKRTQEWASDFVSGNIDTMRNNASGQLLDSGYSNFIEAVRTNVNFQHTAMEVNLLQTITSAPSADHQNAAETAPGAAQPFSTAPPAASPPKAGLKAGKVQHYASMLLAVERFYIAATSRPVPKAEVEILESSRIAQQDEARAIMYPSLQARRGKKQTVPRTSAKDVLEYVRKTRKETEKEINTLSSFSEIYQNDGTLSYLMTEIRRLNKKIWRHQKNDPNTLPSRLLGNMKKEIDDIKVEKARAYAQFISALKML